MRLPSNFRMIERVLVALLLLVALTRQGSAGDRKEWVKLTDCHYVNAPDNDGDSFRVRGGDKEFTARLYYVDAPETNLRHGDRTHDQSLHFGITLDETMKAGEKAKQRTRELLEKPFVIWTRWATAGGRGRESRYYVIVEVDGKNLGEILVSEGLSRTKGVAPNLPNEEKGKAYMERLDNLEDAAREKHLGAWATAPTQTPSPSPAASTSP
jgi:endonuclease YncB( thermonuclease family)